jgi:hypothetical protein
MDWRRAIARRRLVLGAAGVTAVAGAALALALALGGGEGDAPQGQAADSASPAALLAASDLPGSGWTASPDEALTRAAEGTAPIAFTSPPGDECAGLRAFETKLASFDAAFRSGSSRSLERRDGEALLARAEQVVLTFDQDPGLDTLLDGLREAVSSPDFVDCLRLAAELQGAVPEVERVTPGGAAPGGGVAAAVRFRVAPADEGGELVQHVLWWRRGNTLATLTVRTWDSSTDVAGIVRLAEQAVAAAAGP